jgi:NADH-quinone oxidoreductase subunit A
MTELVGYLLLFLAIGAGFIFIHLVAGSFMRPAKPDAEKMTIYECGEPTIGSAWIQFDLRFYVVALLFVIFDVEVAFFFPWAVVFGQANALSRDSDHENKAQVQVAKQELLGQNKDYVVTPEDRQTAGRLAAIAFADILVFFGVLLVGFAYLWKRGDLAWVRSTLAEKAPPPSEPPPLEFVQPARREMAAADSH